METSGAGSRFQAVGVGGALLGHLKHVDKLHWYELLRNWRPFWVEKDMVGVPAGLLKNWITCTYVAILLSATCGGCLVLWQ